MVGSESPERCASWRWSMPRSARAARIWAPVIMFKTSESIVLDLKLMPTPNQSGFQIEKKERPPFLRDGRKGASSAANQGVQGERSAAVSLRAGKREPTSSISAALNSVSGEV